MNFVELSNKKCLEEYMAGNKIVCVSMGADPLTGGHIDLICSAQSYGKVWVILNSDEWLIRKKGYCFMPWRQRAKILISLKHVSHVIAVHDSDGTVCEALHRIKPHFFANGGDRITANPAEDAVCKELGIQQLFGIGGSKTASSSEMVKKAAQYVK